MHQYMSLALEQARLAFEAGETPVGAVVVQGDRVLCACHNEREARNDPLAHAELLALKKAAQVKGDWRFSDCTLYVTLEPCPMCAGALLAARMGRIVFGAYDKDQGCCGSVYLLPMDKALRGTATVCGGVMEEACAALLSDFFKSRR